MTMKRLLFVMMLFGGLLTTQAVDFRFGIKLGASFSEIENRGDVTPSSPTADVNYKTPFVEDCVAGFTGGLAAKIDLWKGFGVDPEVMFHQVSGKLDMNTIHYEDSRGTVKYKVSTIGIPIMLRWRFDFPGRIAPEVFTGPVIGIKVQSGYSYALKASSVQCDWRVGVGLVHNKKTEIAAAYNVGLGNVAKYNEGQFGTRPEISNRASSWTVTLGYFF